MEEKIVGFPFNGNFFTVFSTQWKIFVPFFHSMETFWRDFPFNGKGSARTEVRGCCNRGRGRFRRGAPLCLAIQSHCLIPSAVLWWYGMKEVCCFTHHRSEDVEPMKIKREYTWVWAGFILLALLVFREVLLPGNALFTTDDNLGDLMARKQQLPWGWWRGWNDSALLGFASPLFLNGTNLLLWLFPATTFNNWINAFDLVVGSGFLFLFLRRRGLNGWAAGLGSLAAYWLASNFTLTYAGHIGKFGVLLWVPIYLCLVDEAAKRRSLAWSLLAGAALGAMFLEQADVAFFFALALGPYALLAWFRNQGRDWLGGVKWIAPLLVMTLMISAHPLLSGYQTAVEDVAAVQSEDTQAQWEFITQWSWPPGETLDFIAPGYFGWRSNDPTGFYVGKMGRSAGWEEAGQGFANFKLENQYLGAIPLTFALLAAFLAVRFRVDAKARLDVWFWTIVMALALVLSFGKYFPLYRLFYQLPIVSSIRNPNKFLQLFQLALGICAAYGFQFYWDKAKATGQRSLTVAGALPVLAPVAVVGLGLLLWGIGTLSARETLIHYFLDTWGPLTAQMGWNHEWAVALADNRIWSLLHGGIMALMAALFLYVLATQDRWSPRLSHSAAAVLLGLVVFDVFFLARHYVTTFQPGSMRDNEVIRILQSAPDQRVALTTRAGFYNEWLSIQFPYHGVASIEVAQMPRMPQRYQTYLQRVGGHSVRHWQLGAVQYVLGPAQVWAEISNHPEFRRRFNLVYAYNVERGTGRVLPATEDRPGEHVVIEHTGPRQRYALVPRWREVGDEEALTRLVAADFEPLREVLIASGQDLSALPELSGTENGGRVDRRERRPGYVRLRVAAEQPSILRMADKFDPHWQAELNGNPVPLWRMDYIAKGLYVPSGMHEVVLTYRPPQFTFWLQLVGMLLAAVVGGYLAFKRFQCRHAGGDQHVD